MYNFWNLKKKLKLLIKNKKRTVGDLGAALTQLLLTTTAPLPRESRLCCTRNGGHIGWELWAVQGGWRWDEREDFWGVSEETPCHGPPWEVCALPLFSPNFYKWLTHQSHNQVSNYSNNMTYFLYVTDSTQGKMFHKPELKLQDRGSLVLNALKEFYMDLISWQWYIFKRKNTVLHVE